MSDERVDLPLRIAERIADGEAVDWKTAEADAQMATATRGLRMLEAIACAHREAGEAAPEPVKDGVSGLWTGPTHPGKRDASRPRLDISGAPTIPTPPRMPTPDATPLPERWGHLLIRELIGSGGFGEIFRAYDPGLQREVALKLLRPARASDPAAAERFIEEARRHARVDNKGIVTIHGAAVHDGRAGLWMDLVRGKSLEELLRLQGRFGADEVVQLGIEICGALAAVHAAGLVHRDVKTANILRREGGGYLLMDFGASTEMPDPRVLSGDLLPTGTPLFMAPEQLEGGRPDPAGDIYSLGVVLYRLLSARYPVSARTFEELRSEHRQGACRPLRDVRPDLPQAIVALVERALAADPRQRYGSAGEFERALVAFRSPVPAVPIPPELSDPNPHLPWWTRIWRNHPVAAAVSATCLTVVAMVAIWSLTIQATGPPAPLPGKVTGNRAVQPGAPLQASAALYRVGPDGKEALGPGARVREGDQVFLEIESNRSMNVYVLEEDARGSSTVIFPLDYADEQNPLRPNRIHRLPGTVNGVPHYWNISSTGGIESIFVVASAEPLAELERELQGTPTAKEQDQNAPTEPAEEPSQTAEEQLADAGAGSAGIPEFERRLRGISTTSPGPSLGDEPGEKGQLARLFNRVSVEAARTEGLWTWYVVLENPGP